jgi:hypothetical protein
MNGLLLAFIFWLKAECDRVYSFYQINSESSLADA